MCRAISDVRYGPKADIGMLFSATMDWENLTVWSQHISCSPRIVCCRDRNHIVDRQSHPVRPPGVCPAFGAATPSRALVSRSLVQQDKSNARPTTTMFAVFLAPSVIEHTYGSMRHLLVCQLHLVKRPVNHPRCSRRLEVFATTVSVTDQLEMQQCTSDVCFIPKSIHVQCN